MTTTRSKNLLTLLAAVLLATAALTFIKLDLWGPVAQVDAAIDAGTRADQYVRTYGYRVDITPGPPSDATEGWTSISGGGFVIEPQDVSAGADTHQATHGLITIQELLLTGDLVAGGTVTTANTLPETVDPGVAYAAAEARSRIFTNNFDTDLSRDVIRLEISPLVIPAVASSLADPQYRTFQPGTPESVVIKIDLLVHADEHAVDDWWTATANGEAARKDIVVNARELASDSPDWSVTLVECTIIDYNPWGAGLSVDGASGAVAIQSVSARCEGVAISHSRNDIQQALLDAQLGGGEADRDIAITTIDRDGVDLDVTHYNDAFITRYEFPIFNANEADVIALDTVVFQANMVILP
jgi:hypothetical protein